MFVMVSFVRAPARRGALACLAAACLLIGTQSSFAQVHPNETPDCWLDSDGRVIKRLPREKPANTSAKCRVKCHETAGNTTDPNRCTGYNFVATAASLQTGYVHYPCLPQDC